MTMKSGIILGLLASLLFVGWRFAEIRSERERIAVAKSDRNQQIERLRADKTRLEAEIAAKSGQDSAVAAPGGAPAQSGADEVRKHAPQHLATLIADKVIRLNSGPTSGDLLVPSSAGGFPSEFARFFGLGEAEATRLSEVMKRIKTQVEAAIAAHSTVSRKEDGSVVIACDPLPEGE